MVASEDVHAGRKAVLTVRDLRVEYRTQEAGVPALRGISLDLFPGEILALVGESGAGKTSVAHAILGLLPGNASMSGDIRYRGRVLDAMSDEEIRHLRGAEIAMIFQDAQSSLTPSMTIGDQVAEIFRAHRHMDPKEARRAGLEALRRTLPDVDRVADAYPFQISGGMAQRVMISMATALDPRVIIADEPTANLDPAVRMETLQQLEDLRNDGTAVLVITHDFGVVARIADRVGVMYAGQIIEEADVRTIFRRPRHPYTAGLLDSIPGIQRRERLVPMRGNPPDMANLPPECPYLPRCTKAINTCRQEPAPALVAVEDSVEGHRVACFNPMAVDRVEATE
jgi:oligopeptide/dipeptide ABC transporter ATP-binding protein